MAVVVDQTIPSEIEEQYKKCLTKAHRIHSERDIVTKVPPFRQPTWQGFRPDLPTQRQTQVRRAFKKCCNCWNKLEWEKKEQLWQENEDQGYDIDYFRYWMHKAIGIFYHDDRHEWCTPEMLYKIVWEHAYYKRGGACLDATFEGAWHYAEIMWDYASWVELPDPFMGEFTGFWANCYFDSATNKWWIFFQGVWGKGKVDLAYATEETYSSVAFQCKPNQDLEKYKSGLYWNPKPTWQQRLMNLRFPFQSEYAPWRIGNMSFGELIKQNPYDWLAFELYNTIYDPETIKYQPGSIQGNHWIGGVGTQIDLQCIKKDTK